MNIFREPESFIVRASVDAMLEADKDFFETAVEIRRRLGKRAYVLDNYLSMALEAANHQYSLFESAEGDDTGHDTVRRMARDIQQGGVDEKRASDPLYCVIRDAVAKYSEKFQDTFTVYDLVSIVGYREVVPKMAEDFVGRMLYGLREKCDIIHLDELFKEISRGAGEEQVEKLNDLIMRRFLIVPVLDVYLQAFTHQYLFSLLHRDDETCKQIFQLLLDEMAQGASPAQTVSEG